MNTRAIELGETVLVKVVLANKAAFFAVMFAIVLAIGSPYFLTPANIFSLLDQIVVFTIVALAATFLLGAGEIDLSIIGIVPFVGAVMAKLMMEAAWPWWAAVMAGVATGVACGLLNAGLISLFGLPSFIVTLATGAVFQGITFIITGLVAVSGLPDDFVVLGQGRLGMLTIPVILLIPIVAIFVVMAKTSVFGQHVIAMANNPQAVRAAGISTHTMRVKLFLLMGLCSGVAAVILTARSGSAQPTAGANLLLLVVAAVVIGGTPITGGKVMMLGTFFGSLTIGMISNGLNLIGINSNFQIATQGIVILLALYVDSQTTRLTNFIAKRRLRRQREPD